jgi:hypothetical protein
MCPYSSSTLEQKCLMFTLDGHFMKVILFISDIVWHMNKKLKTNPNSYKSLQDANISYPSLRHFERNPIQRVHDVHP